MANSTKCLTSGAIFSTHIKEDKISVNISLPFSIDLTKDEAVELETLMHNQMEIVLRPYFDKKIDIETLSEKIKSAINDNSSLCMDNKSERGILLESIISRLTKFEWWRSNE